MVSVLRDNPNVNKKLVAMVDQYMKDQHYTKLLDVGACALHPTHTSFRKALDELDIDVWSFAVDLHGYFKISTSWREDILDISLLFESETDLFFLQPVDTHWLSTQPVLERIQKKWGTITQYFCTFVKNSYDQKKKMPGKLLVTREFWNFWNLVRMNSHIPLSVGLFIWPIKPRVF